MRAEPVAELGYALADEFTDRLPGVAQHLAVGAERLPLTER